MADAATPTPTRRRAPGWLWALLIASLAINLAVAGIVIAHNFVPGRHMRHAGGGLAHLLPPRFVHHLPRQRRDAVRQVLRRHRPVFIAARRRLAAAAEPVARALEADPFDGKALAAALADYAGGIDAMVADAARTFIDVAQELSPVERRALAGVIRERAARHARSRSRK